MIDNVTGFCHGVSGTLRAGRPALCVPDSGTLNAGHFRCVRPLTRGDAAFSRSQPSVTHIGNHRGTQTRHPPDPLRNEPVGTKSVVTKWVLLISNHRPRANWENVEKSSIALTTVVRHERDKTRTPRAGP